MTGKNSLLIVKNLELDQAWVMGKGKGRLDQGGGQKEKKNRHIHHTCNYIIHVSMATGNKLKFPVRIIMAPFWCNPWAAGHFYFQLYKESNQVMSDTAKTRACYNFSTTWLLWKYWHASHRLQQQANNLIACWLQRYQRYGRKQLAQKNAEQLKMSAIINVPYCANRGCDKMS